MSMVWSDNGFKAPENKKKIVAGIFLSACLFILLNPVPAFAYIGPGAGFALLSSLLTLLISFLLAFSC